MINLLDITRPFIRIIPTIKKPSRKLNVQEKIVWTLIALIVYLVASQIPLYGMQILDSADPLYLLRRMMASNRGTLMDLGLSPIISSGMIINLLKSFGLVTFSGLNEDRILYNGLEKGLAILLTLGQASASVFAGLYGNFNSIGAIKGTFIVIQLICSGILVTLLDDLLTTHSFGTGINLFIAANVCEKLLWHAFSPKVFQTARGPQFEGAILALFHFLFVRKNKFNAIIEIFTRVNLPNLSSLFTTTLFFCIVIYIQGMKVDVPIQSIQVASQRTVLPIRLLYASTTPVISQGQLITHLCTISKLLFDKFPDSRLVRLLGVWETNEYGKVLVSGFCSLLVAPPFLSDIKLLPLLFWPARQCISVARVFINPILGFRLIKQKLLYLAKTLTLKFIMNFLLTNVFNLRNIFWTTWFVCTSLFISSLLSRAWVVMQDTGSRSMAQKLKNDKMQIVGLRDVSRAEAYLDTIVPAAATLGGFVIGAVILCTDVFDSAVSGANIFLCVSIVWKYCESLANETLKTGRYTFNA
ncbi:Protein transport protein Sec61 subunit alpha [Cucumispora dikerogammari]|nr:Protein transport protein Sec61 subunit alpha [Cucumispora dikerogammari]